MTKPRTYAAYWDVMNNQLTIVPWWGRGAVVRTHNGSGNKNNQYENNDKNQALAWILDHKRAKTEDHHEAANNIKHYMHAGDFPNAAM